MISKKYLLIGATSFVILAGVLSMNVASAAYAQGVSDDTFVQKLAAKLGLTEQKVQTAMTDLRDERHAEMLTKHESELNTAVSNGEMTNAQKDLILAKMKEMQQSHQSKMEDMHDKTPAERRAIMREERDALEAWAMENNIDMKYLRPMAGKGFGEHRGRMGGLGKMESL